MTSDDVGIYYNAIHEAGHVIIALYYHLHVEAVLIKPPHTLATRTNFNPAQTLPCVVLGMKHAGAIAVRIQNEALGRSDDDGFGTLDDPDSDAAWVARVTTYLTAMTMPSDAVRGTEGQMKVIVERTLRENWACVEAVAREIMKVIASGGNRIEASGIGEVLRIADPQFYGAVETYLGG